jgi:hypothetical protein
MFVRRPIPLQDSHAVAPMAGEFVELALHERHSTAISRGPTLSQFTG